MSRYDHPSYKNSRRDDAATSPRAGESTTGRAPAARTAAAAGAHHRGRTDVAGVLPQHRHGGYGWALLGIALVIAGTVASCHHDADGQPFCAEVACTEHDG
jgi:hypothetical protein